VVIPRRRGLDPWLALRLSSWIRREGVALVHTHNPGPHLYGALAAALARAGSAERRGWPRVVHTKHGRNYPRLRRKVLANRLASSLTDRVVAVSEDARAVVVDVEGVDPARVVTILNGVDTDEFRPGGDPREARARLGVPAEGFHVGCVARLSPEKDHATLLAAFARFRAGRPDAHLTLVGGGALRPALVGEAARLGLAGAVTFAGTQADVAALLPAFDVFALSSRTEGISLTLIEAAAAGIPLVATRVGGNAEILGEDEAGFLVPPGEPGALAAALERVAGRPDRAELGRRGRARVVSRFGIDRMARAYGELYAELLDL
jgi:glycosyltransferase involved in cell wall biosynthesis